jgi:hypothetical protein
MQHTHQTAYTCMLGVACFMQGAACCVLHAACCMPRVAQEVPRARIAVGLGDSTGGLYNLEWINNEYVPPASMRRLFYVALQLKARIAKPRFAELRVHVSYLQHCTVAWRYTGYRRILRAPGSSCCAAPLCDCGAAAQPQHSGLARCCPKALHCAAHRTALRAAARVGVSQTLLSCGLTVVQVAGSAHRLTGCAGGMGGRCRSAVVVRAVRDG